MAKFGLQGLSNNPFLYLEAASGSSIAAGMDASTGNYNIVTQTTTGATPAGTYQIQIVNSANGNINITPLGSGSCVVSKATIQSGTVDNTTLGATTPASVNATSYALNGVPLPLPLLWTAVTGASQTLAVDNGYISARGAGVVAFTLPATATIGSVIRIVGDATNGLGWTLAQAAGQYIQLGATKTTVGVGGSLASTVNSDCIELICTTAGASTGWVVGTSVGNITIV